jgi:hypothetical protein
MPPTARPGTQQSVSLVSSAFPTRLLVRRVAITDHDHIAVEKQKKLLHEATGHFTLIRMLHLADLITELNGS